MATSGFQKPFAKPFWQNQQIQKKISQQSSLTEVTVVAQWVKVVAQWVTVIAQWVTVVGQWVTVVAQRVTVVAQWAKESEISRL